MDLGKKENISGVSSECQFGVLDSCSSMYMHPANPHIGWNAGILPPTLSSFATDSGFVERATRLSHFGRDNFNNESTDAGISGDVQEQVPNSSSRGIGTKRKRSGQDVELCVEKSNTENKCELNSSTMATVKYAGKNAKDDPDAPKEDYIHVRARRGQATNSHSLAERVRREKISERMKFLQDLVPGCSKVTGKAVMLDEIINYVQSLQRQVEFLSMKLAAVNPRVDSNIEGLLSKDVFQFRGGSSSAMGFSPEMIHTHLHPYQPSPSPFQATIPGTANTSDALRRSVNVQLTAMNGYKEPIPEMANAWDDELNNVVQMTFGANASLNTTELIGRPRDTFPL